MALRAVVEVGVCLTKFTNVDLHNQGAYRFSVSLCKVDDEKYDRAVTYRDAVLLPAIKINRKEKDKTYNPHKLAPLKNRATPYSCFDTALEKAKVNGFAVKEEKMFGGAHINDVSDVFYSKTFMVRYVDEQRFLNDGVHFRLELDSLKETTVPLRMLVALERADPLNEQGDNGTLPPKKPTNFEVLSVRVLYLNNPMEGFHEYLPIIFDDSSSSGFALVEATVHASITNLRFEAGTFHEPSDARALEFPGQNATLEEFMFSSNDALSRDNSRLLTKEDPLINSADHLRRKVLFLLRSSYSSLSNCVDLILKHEPLEKSNAGYEVQLGSQLELGPLPALVLPTSLTNRTSFDGQQHIVPTAETKNNDEPHGRTVAEYTHQFSTELESISSTLLLTWHALLQYQRSNSHTILSDLKSKWLSMATDRVGESIIRERLHAEEIARSTPDAKHKERLSIASKIRQSTAKIREFQKDPIDDSEMFEDPSAYPVVFEQTYTFEDTAFTPPLSAAKSLNVSGLQNPKERHFVVLIHGFLGSSWDMRPFRNYLSIVEPDVITLLSQANENDTDSDFAILGFRLAHEVKSFITNHLKETNDTIGKISFICHSIGSIILRNALSHRFMEPYLPHLYTFISLSSPHLGSRNLSSSIVKYGLLAIRYWRKATALSQLAMTDNTNLRETMLYKLSQCPIGLRKFKNVVLISSTQDQYVPYHSTRIEPVDPSKYTNPLDGQVANEMVSNILEGLDHSVLLRLDLCFQFDNVKTRKVDKIIGRAAHVKILDSPALALLLLLQYRERIF